MRIIFKILAIFCLLGFIGNLIAAKLHPAGLVVGLIFAYFGWRKKE